MDHEPWPTEEQEREREEPLCPGEAATFESEFGHSMDDFIKSPDLLAEAMMFCRKLSNLLRIFFLGEESATCEASLRKVKPPNGR